MSHSVFHVSAAVLLACAACESGSSAQPSEQVASLEFTTTSSIASNPPPPVHVVVSDPERAQNAYALTLALPEAPAEPTSCPLDFGISYELTFGFRDGSAPLQLSVRPGGCRIVHIPGANDRRVDDEGYWSALAHELGIDEAAIYPYRRPG